MKKKLSPQGFALSGLILLIAHRVPLRARIIFSKFRETGSRFFFGALPEISSCFETLYGKLGRIYKKNLKKPSNTRDVVSKLKNDLQVRWKTVLDYDPSSPNPFDLIDLIMQQESDLFLLNLYKEKQQTKLSRGALNELNQIIQTYRHALDDFEKEMRGETMSSQSALEELVRAKLKALLDDATQLRDLWTDEMPQRIKIDVTGCFFDLVYLRRLQEAIVGFNLKISETKWSVVMARMNEDELSSDQIEAIMTVANIAIGTMIEIGSEYQKAMDRLRELVRKPFPRQALQDEPPNGLH